MNRREFLQHSTRVGATAALWSQPWRALAQASGAAPAFQISLAGWSLHRRHFREGRMPLLDFPQVAREEFGLAAIELVNTMFPSPHYRFLQDLSGRAEKHGVQILLIMCDAEGDLSSTDEAHRRLSVRNHHKWVDVADILGCHSIRVNTGGKAGDTGAIERCADSLRQLADYSGPQGISILVENHGGLSSHPESLVRVMELADSPWVGTLPDFGNFPDTVDRYEAVAAMMPYAKAVSAKCHDFDEDGEETRTDFRRMMRIVADAGYTGFVGIEYEGKTHSEAEGIRQAKALLERIQRGD